MQLRKIAKAITAGTLAAIMAGATVGFATTLADYPAPFVTDGTVDALIVVGANAATADVVGAIDLAARLGAVPSEEKTIEVAGTSATTTLSGGVSLDSASEKIYLGDNINTVVDTLTGKDLSILGKDTFEDDDGTTYDYTQYIEIGSRPIKFVQEETDEDPIIEIEMSTNSGEPLYTEKITFTKAINFTDTAVQGNTIKFFGKEFTISSDSTNTKIVLYKSAEEITLNKDEETTVTIGGTDYTIKVLGFDTSNDKVVLTVNGDTDDIEEGYSKKVGGLEIYAKTVTAWDNGNQGIAILQVGSEKVILEDGESVKVGDDEDEIDGTSVTITGSPVSSIEINVFAPDSDSDYIAAGDTFEDPVFGTFKVAFGGISDDLKSDDRDQISFRVSGDYKGYVTFKDVNGEDATIYFVYGTAANTTELKDDSQNNIYVVEGAVAKEDEIIFLTPGTERYTHMVKIDKIEIDSSNGYVEFKDIITGETYKTEIDKFENNGDPLDLIVDGKKYKVTLEDATNEKISVIFDDNETVVYPAIELNNGEKLAFTNNVTDIISVSGDTPGTGLAGGTLILPTGKLTVTYDVNSSNVVTDVYVDGTPLELGSSKSIKEGSVYYVFSCDSSGSTVTCDIAIEDDQTGSGSAEENPGVLIVEEEDDNNNENAVVVTASADANKYINYDFVAFTASTEWTGVNTADDEVTANLDYYGTYVEEDTSDSDHTVVTVWYPDNQVYALVAVGENPTWSTTEGAEGGTVTYKEVVPITTPIAALDSEVTSDKKTTKNLILIGGPCANSLVQELVDSGKLGNEYTCAGGTPGSAWEPNTGYIILVNDAFAEGKAALVVAGTTATETVQACRILQDYEAHADELTGTAVKIVNNVITPITMSE